MAKASSPSDLTKAQIEAANRKLTDGAIGLWVDVEGFGVGEVVAFHQEKGFKDSQHEINFTFHGKKLVLLRRKKAGAFWNGGRAFTVLDAEPPPPAPTTLVDGGHTSKGPSDFLTHPVVSTLSTISQERPAAGVNPNEVDPKKTKLLVSVTGISMELAEGLLQTHAGNFEAAKKVDGGAGSEICLADNRCVISAVAGRKGCNCSESSIRDAISSDRRPSHGGSWKIQAAGHCDKG